MRRTLVAVSLTVACSSSVRIDADSGVKVSETSAGAQWKVGVDAERVPLTLGCEEGQYVVKTGDGWTCVVHEHSDFSGLLAGDVAGTQAATKVEALRGVTVSTTRPATGQVLGYDGAKWTPTTVAPGLSGTGTHGMLARFETAESLGNSTISGTSAGVGIGTLSPNGHGSGASGPFLDVYTVRGLPEIYLGHNDVTGFAGTIGAYSTGTPSSDKRLAMMAFAHDGSSSSAANGNIQFFTAAEGRNALRMQIGNSGVGIGTAPSAPNVGLTVQKDGGNSDQVLWRTSAVGLGNLSHEVKNGREYGLLVLRDNGEVKVAISADGTAAKPGGGSWTSSSDRRLKTNIAPIAGALDRLMGLRGVSYEWKEPEKNGNLRGTQIGMIAQDVEAVFPDWVGTDSRGFKTLTYRGFEALAVESLRELNAKVGVLEAEVKRLRAEASRTSSR